MATRRATKEGCDADAKHERLRAELGRLVRKGLSQLEVAQQVGVQPQYLSDVKTGRRAITELFARRLAERLGLDYQWLMKGKRVMTGPVGQDFPHAVPVLNAPCDSNPRESVEWDGSFVELAGPAAVAARGAKNPYAVRLVVGSRAMQIPKGALLLASQGVDASRKVAVVKTGDSLCLAQRDERDPDSWRAVLTGKRLVEDVKVVGCIVGVIWAPM